MKQWLNKRVQRLWAERSILSYGLTPFAVAFSGIATTRRWMYSHFLKPRTLPVPVIVVGNITVGGTGKTPFVIWLAKALQAKGYRPGIVTRGYKGSRSKHRPILVTSHVQAKAVGDEALVLAQQTGCPVMAGRDRTQAVLALYRRDPKINVIISDDGLQHYRMARQIEIVMMDAVSRWGNGFCLPAGPLREKPCRLDSVDLVIANHGEAEEANWQMTTAPSVYVYNVNRPSEKRLLSSFKDHTIHAFAGIGVPERFFGSLEQQGLNIIRHPFPDHTIYQKKDFNIAKGDTIFMTQKDAVKCHTIAPTSAWYVVLEATLPDACLTEILRRLPHGSKIT
jgi:tetraacyldisaccharide 4'-kinase